MVGDHPVPHIVGRAALAVAARRVPGYRVDHRPQQVGFVDVVDPLQQAGNPFDPHAGVDVLARQRAENLEVVFAGAVTALVLHEDQVPDLDIAVLVGLWAALDAVLRAAVVVNLRTRAARTWNTHRPVVVGHAAALDALGWQSGYLLPQPDGLVVVVEHGGPQPLGIESVPARGNRIGQQRPGQFDRAALEIVAEREVSGHLKKGVVPGCNADLVDVRGPNALLDTGRGAVGRGALAQEVGNELDHAGIDEKQIGIIEDHRGAGYLRMAGIDEVGEKTLPDLVCLHGWDCPCVSSAACCDGGVLRVRVGPAEQERRPPHITGRSATALRLSRAEN